MMSENDLIRKQILDIDDTGIEFSIDDLKQVKRRFKVAEKAFLELTRDLIRQERCVKEAEWRLFVTTLPQIDSTGYTYNELHLNGMVWKSNGMKSFMKLPARVFMTETSDNTICVFDKKYYL